MELHDKDITVKPDITWDRDEERKIIIQEIETALEAHPSLRENFGEYSVTSLDDNWIIQFPHHATSDTSLVLYDFDDTLVATTQAKALLRKAYAEYVDSLQKGTSQHITDQLVDSAFDFAHWKEPNGKRRTYHVQAHMQTLQWATQEYSRLLHEGISPESAIQQISQQLDDIKNGTLPEHVISSFKLDTTTQRYIPSPDIDIPQAMQTVFTYNNMQAPPYTEALDSMKDGHNDEKPYDVGILTYGEPPYQLRKVLAVLASHPDIPIAHILLTRAQKGDFLLRVFSEAALSITPHTVVILDDSPKQLHNILNVCVTPTDKPDIPRIVPVRSIQTGIKRETEETDTDINILDFRTGHHDIGKRLQDLL